ncbi:molybdopterin biosynthesis protein [Leptolinea tardivitalis]|uniref:Molybdopterin molybdenumtransferase n=1 Tax=Leptolinea tardivitalis TaxID=229920 RepID=A0A0N8GLM3_9CHLR|nr:molybdopterin biosynthesis protein [Leptolinea tardivitalis]KPL72898.1 LysR family transcriptional regulator [Leptolinea tardivitalis]GAP20716.1 molybdopterin molybdochelatase [Leptolinea tardivitalis]
MSIYLHDIPLTEAKSRFQQELKNAGLWGVLGQEEIPLDEKAAGRVLAESVWARISSPHYHASAMDGFAIRAENSLGAAPSNPVQLRYEEQAVYVDTGDPLPQWANAVIPIENVEPLDDTGHISTEPRHPYSIRIRAAITPWSHVRPMGEDIVATELVIPAGQTLRPVDLGALAASGQTSLKVARVPRVAILPTGTELVPIGSDLKAGDIIEFNSVVLGAQVNQWGGKADRFPITIDNFDAICQRVEEAARDHDLILLNAGSSAGSEDFSVHVTEKLGTVLVHGVAVRPGHPVILGMITRKDNSKIPIIGVPGYPVSAALTGEIFVQPLLTLWLGRKDPSQEPVITAKITRKVNSPQGDDDFMRVAVGRVNGQVLAAPLAKGAGMINTLVHADGIALVPRGIQGLEAGDDVQVKLYRSLKEIDQTIFAIGSHDLTLDILAQFLAQRERRLVSVNVGSQGGLVALRRGEAHFAGSHLLDPETGVYNKSYINQYLPDTPVSVFNWVGREQGLIVQKGNPKNILSLKDLERSDISYVNRQRGSGTRVLLDYQLGKLGLSAERISGYAQEEYTHLAVAAAVKSGRADCGMGITAAANALELDFIPLYTEQYQLVIPNTVLENHLLDPLFDLTQDPEFKKAVLKLPGYTVSDMGRLVEQ